MEDRIEDGHADSDLARRGGVTRRAWGRGGQQPRNDRVSADDSRVPREKAPARSLLR